MEFSDWVQVKEKTLYSTSESGIAGRAGIVVIDLDGL